SPTARRLATLDGAPWCRPPPRRPFWPTDADARPAGAVAWVARLFQFTPVSRHEALRVHIADLPFQLRHAVPAAPFVDRVVAGRERRNEAGIGVFAAPLRHAGARRAIRVGLAAWQIGAGGADQDVTGGAAEHGGAHCGLRRHAGLEQRVDR